MAVPSNVDQFKQWFQSYTLAQKVAIFGSAAGVVVLLWVMVYFVNQVDYQILYAELEAADAQGVMQRLDGMQVPFELSPDGATIRVPQNRLAEVRIDLAAEGLPSSGRIGFEIFDRTNFGLTNFQEQVNYQRALEGELSRSITTLEEVEAARVHLVMTSNSLFRSDQEQTKASVILRVRRGRSLAAGLVDGIVHLVASSVKGLEPTRVTVVDYAGRLLSRTDDDSPMSGQQVDTQLKIESDLALKITGILEPVVGIGRVRPQVSVVMDWQQVEETIEQYDPDGSVIRSQQRNTERSSNGNADEAIGVPGPQGEAFEEIVGIDPAADPNAVGNDAGGFLADVETVNFEVSKSVRHIVSPVGEIQRMSVAVLLDNRMEINVDEEGVTTTTSVPWSNQEMAQYRNLISATVGVDPARGDTLTVENVSFGTDQAFDLEPATLLERQAPLILTALRYLLIPFVFLIVYLLFLRPVQKTIFAKWEPQLRGGLPAAGNLALEGGGGVQTPMSLSDLEAAINTAPLPSLPSSGAAAPSVPAIPRGISAIPPSEEAHKAEREFLPLPSSHKVDLIRNRIVEHAKREPETVARMVRAWLSEDKDK
jgi:flagellar M-ring protein FliF